MDLWYLEVKSAVPELRWLNKRLVAKTLVATVNNKAAAKYKSWSVTKLKTDLAARGAVTTGRKVNLIERLLAYDRNFNFKPPPIILPQPDIVGWPVSGFKQLVPDHRILFSKVKKEQIDGYFIYRLAGDRHMTGDLKALEKGRDMFEGNRILACSVQVFVDNIFLSGIVGAAMRNKVTYNFKLKLDRVSGSPVNSDCECPAGKGPHATCKHIAAVLLMIEHFSCTGNVSVEKSCTEDLQRFHQPKSYYEGEPVVAEKIPTKKKLSEDTLADPRPAKYRNNIGYNDFVRNAMVNYCAATSSDLSLRYIYPKANLQSAQKDHDYLTSPFAEYWVDQALQITENEAILLEKDTEGQADNKKWFEARRWRITASRFGDVTKITKRRNIAKLCESLLSPKKINAVSMHHGTMFEKKAICKFESQFNLNVKKAGLFVCVEWPYLGASPDGKIGIDTIVEVKCPYRGRNDFIKPGILFPFLTYENDNIALKTSSKYYDQIQGQLLLSKRNTCYFIVYTFVDMFVQKIEVDMDYCVGCLIPKLELFYTKYFRKFIAASL